MTERIRRILRGKNITPKTADEAAVKYAVENGGGGGSGLPAVTTDDNGKLLGVVGGEWNKVVTDNGIVRVPFTIDATQAEITGSTDAVFADVLAARKAGKLVVATGTVNVGLAGVTQYFDCIMSGLDAGNDSRLEGVFLMLSGSGTKIEAYDIQWTSTGVNVAAKNIEAS